jgi:hypothetical protein
VELSNSTWEGAADNTFEPDGIAFLLPDEIRYYREQRPLHRLPVDCAVWIWQNMAINGCGGGAETMYDQHLPRNMMDSLYLGVEKAGLVFWRSWP